jgi:sialate O-acetylesterase
MIGETIEAEYAADFSVSRVFSNDMVVQRGEHIRVWGFAPESENGKKISGEFKGMSAEALIENGEWCLTFGARLEADVNGAEMKIYAGENKTVTFPGVLVGDVYMVVGQSNVEYSVQQHINNTNAATQGGGTDASDPNSIIRLNRINNSSGGSFDKKGTAYVYKDAQATKQWTKTTQSDTLGFSAIGYYFAKNIVENTNGEIPVGIIEFGFSGAPLGSYLPNEIAEKHDTDTLSSATGKYVTTGVNAGKSPGRYIYNCHMAAFEKYAIAGLIWYQGESNNTYDEASKYNEVFSSLVSYMRKSHNVVNKNFPVFITEFPSIYKKPAGYTDTWHFMELGIIRSFMGSIPYTLKNSYVAVSSDLWADKTFFNSLHPNCKFEQAERLAALANVVICGSGTLDKATGPIFESVSVSADKKTVVITFTNVGEGLTTKDGGKAVKGIVGFGAKTIGLLAPITPKSAEITANDQITVTFDEEVKAVAYNFLSSDLYGETLNLCNSAKCPASAFVTPYKEMDLSGFEAKDFVAISNNSLGFKRKSIDRLNADGAPVFSSGGIESNLSAAGNKIELAKGMSKLTCQGWIGFKYASIVFGYSIDGGNAVFNAAPITPEQAVINAGGKHAVRFDIKVDVSDLSVGDHTVSFLVLVDVNGGTAAKLLTFTVKITEPAQSPE